MDSRLFGDQPSCCLKFNLNTEPCNIQGSAVKQAQKSLVIKSRSIDVPRLEGELPDSGNSVLSESQSSHLVDRSK